MSKHTPAPWIIVENEWNDDDVDKQPSRGHSFGSIVSLNASGEREWFIARIDNAAEDRANARLIVAAPALLKECKAALIDIRVARVLSEKGFDRTIQRLQAVIAEAEVE